MSDPRRNRELGAIHCAKRDLGLEDPEYRDILWSVARVRSARDLDQGGRAAVIEHFRNRGWRPKTPGRPKPAREKERLLYKIKQQLKEADLPDVYADGMAKKMCGVMQLHWCTPDQLRKIIAALNYRARRRKQ